jgi:hypothetical protein
MKLATNAQNANRLNGRKANPFNLPRSVKAKDIMISIALNIAMTPNNCSYIVILFK